MCLHVPALGAPQSNRLGYDVSFSEAGGVEIEENWDKVRHVTLEVEQPAAGGALAPLLAGLPLELRAKMEAFIQACYEARCCCCCDPLRAWLCKTELARMRPGQSLAPRPGLLRGARAMHPP
jgi:hypothetical protein